jgi:hypothetical protein
MKEQEKSKIVERLTKSTDSSDGFKAFKEKRQPVWKKLDQAKL